jgi:hypothetical protein
MTVIGGLGNDREEPGEVSQGESTLAFDEDGESLPWLESGDDMEDERGIDSSRIMAFAIGGVALLGLLIGLVWWLSHRGPDPELVADGSTIEAPKDPYKTRPENPGGKTFEGTGDTSFAVGEGQTREGRIAGNEAPAPSIAAGTDAKTPAQTNTAVPTAPKASGGVAVQVGAFSSEASAEAGWAKLATRHEALKGVSHRVVQGSADIGTVFRLQAISGDRTSAEQLCAALKAQGAACQVK